MPGLTRSNILKSFRTISAGVTGFDSDFLTYKEAHGVDTSRLIHRETLTLWPAMYGTPSGLQGVQSQVFGWYALRAAARSTLMCANWLVAARILLDQQLLGPATATAYTAAYHALHGFLALRGRVICDPYIWVGPPLGAPPPAIAGILTDRNTWRFESRKRSHRDRWIEVRQLYPSPQSEVPQAFLDLFAFFFRGRLRKGATLLEFLKDPNGNRPSIQDHWQEFLEMIAHVRHVALYASFGEDPHIVEGLVNGDTFSTAGIEGQATELTLFAERLLRSVGTETAEILSVADCQGHLRDWLFMSVHNPWTDNPRLDQMNDPELREVVHFVREAIAPTDRS